MKFNAKLLIWQALLAGLFFIGFLGLSDKYQNMFRLVPKSGVTSGTPSTGAREASPTTESVMADSREEQDGSEEVDESEASDEPEDSEDPEETEETEEPKKPEEPSAGPHLTGKKKEWAEKVAAAYPKSQVPVGQINGHHFHSIWLENHQDGDLPMLTPDRSPYSDTWDNSVSICACMLRENTTDVREWLLYHRCAPLK